MQYEDTVSSVDTFAGFFTKKEQIGLVNCLQEERLRELMPFGIPCKNGKIMQFRRICYDIESDCGVQISRFLEILEFEEILDKNTVIDFCFYRDKNKNLYYQVRILYLFQNNPTQTT